MYAAGLRALSGLRLPLKIHFPFRLFYGILFGKPEIRKLWSVKGKSHEDFLLF